MLKTLHIQDYALIEKIAVEFGKGLNIITGETGAGKSILIDALGMLLGERASTEVVRKGAQKSFVEGIFDVEQNSKIKKLLEENDIDFVNELIVRREISLKGSNRSFLNDTPVTLGLLKEAGNLLVDLHGQHEHQSLLRTETHIEVLDEFAGVEQSLIKYQYQYSVLNKIISELKELRQKEKILAEKKDYYSFQVKEIDAVSPEAGEDKLLEDELLILENSERLLELGNSIYEKLYETDESVYDTITKIQNEINELNSIDKSFSEVSEEFRTAVTIIKDVSDYMRAYREKVDLDPERLESMRSRLSSLNLLKKKYGGSIENILELRKKLGDELDLAENFSERITELESQIKTQREKCGKEAEALSAKRKSSAKVVEKEIVNALDHLGITDSVFKVSITQNPADSSTENYIVTGEKKFRCSSSGYDSIEFYISTNRGEDPKPLIRVASGGEISRIMLALKTILAKNDKLPLLIFDEIDTGVSGRIAQKVGQSLKALSKFHQIISITHLPQIAGFADHHFMVKKEAAGDRVISSLNKLDEESRIREIAKLLSGELVTEASIKGAKELMQHSR